MLQKENYWFLDELLCAFSKAGWSAEALWAQVLGRSDVYLVQRPCADWETSGPLEIYATTFWGDGSQMQALYSDPLPGNRIEPFAFVCDDSDLG